MGGNEGLMKHKKKMEHPCRPHRENSNLTWLWFPGVGSQMAAGHLKNSKLNPINLNIKNVHHFKSELG